MRVQTLRLISSLILFIAATVLAGSPIWNLWPTGTGTNKASDPTFSPTGFTSPCHGAQQVTISTSTIGAQIRYNQGPSPADPTCSSGTLITGSSGTINVTADADTLVKAIAFTTCGVGTDSSNVIEAEYDFGCSH